MGLVQVATNTVTSAVASVTLTGIDSSDVYMVAYNNQVPATDGTNLNIRFTVSGTGDSSSNYDRAFKKLSATSSYSNQTSTNQNLLRVSSQNTGTGTSESGNGIIYLYNFNNSSEYSFITSEETIIGSTQSFSGNMGGGVLTENQSNDGIEFIMSSGNIASGTFTLYRCV